MRQVKLSLLLTTLVSLLLVWGLPSTVQASSSSCGFHFDSTQDPLYGDGNDLDDYFGYSLAVDDAGDVLVVAELNLPSDGTGKVHVFSRTTGSTFERFQFLGPEEIGAGSSDLAGIRMDLSGNGLVMAFAMDTPPSIEVYSRDSKADPFALANNLTFANFVGEIKLSTEGDLLIASVPGRNASDEGQIFVYRSPTEGDDLVEAIDERDVFPVSLNQTDDNQFGMQNRMVASADGRRICVSRTLTYTAEIACLDFDGAQYNMLGGQHWPAYFDDGPSPSGPMAWADMAMDAEGNTLVIAKPFDTVNEEKDGSIYIVSVDNTSAGNPFTSQGKLSRVGSSRLGSFVAISGNGNRIAAPDWLGRGNFTIFTRPEGGGDFTNTNPCEAYNVNATAMKKVVMDQSGELVVGSQPSLRLGRTRGFVFVLSEVDPTLTPTQAPVVTTFTPTGSPSAASSVTYSPLALWATLVLATFFVGLA